MNKHQSTMEYIKCKFSLHVLLNKSLRFSLFSVRNLIILPGGGGGTRRKIW